MVVFGSGSGLGVIGYLKVVSFREVLGFGLGGVGVKAFKCACGFVWSHVKVDMVHTIK